MTTTATNPVDHTRLIAGFPFPADTYRYSTNVEPAGARVSTAYCRTCGPPPGTRCCT